MGTLPRLCLSVMVLWLGVAAVQADTFINQSAKVRAADGSNSDGFGYSVAGSTAASGDAMIIGAYNDSDFGLASGSAYVFRKSGSSWIQQAKLLANDGAGADNFGYTVAIAGDFAFVGSPQDDDLGQNSGSVYVYRFNGTSWVQHQKLHASDGVTYDYFGVSVAMTTDTAIVGAWYDDDGGSNTGSAYVFKYQASSGQWTQQAKVTAQTPIDYALFGCSVAISADRVIIGAFQNNSAYVFRNTSGSTWVQEARLTPQVPTASGADRFGCSVAISNGLAIVGAKQGHGYYGSALVYRFNGSTWIQEQELLASDAAFYQGFGTSVSISGNTALIGAPSANSNRGAGYLFTYNGSWVQQSRLIASDGLTGVSFAFSSALFNNQAVIGAYTDPLGTIVSGSAYVFPVSATPPTNTAPVVTISSPATNITVVSGTSITFSGTATDTQSGNLNASLIWTSNLQSPSQIGTGATFAKSNLVVGTHTITASATDPGGLSGSATITLSIVQPPPTNTAPIVTIVSPASGAIVTQGSPVSFNGSANDAEQGNLSSSLLWTSNLQGSLGNGASFSTSSLIVGTHTIAASATDTGGLTGQSSISLVVVVPPPPNTTPVVTISSPLNGSSVVAGSSVTFSGSAMDTQSGNLSSSLIWTSNLQVPSQIGTGSSFALLNLAVGTHTITAHATDPGNLTGNSSVTLLVTPAIINTSPSVTITNPIDGSNGTFGSAITFAGNASDNQDGTLTAVMIWTSSIQGLLGTGSPINRSDLAVGTHTITASAVDSGGMTGSATVNITVSVPPNTAPVITISSPSNGASAVAGSSILFSGTANDAESGNLSASLVWTSSLQGPIGSGSSFSYTGLVAGSHTITASATDPGNLSGTASVTVTITPPVTNTAPVVAISSPSNGSASTVGTMVTFTGSASDQQSGSLTSLITWSSNLQGVIGTGGSFSRSDLMLGTHVITAACTDPGGLTGSASISITMNSATTTVPSAPTGISASKLGSSSVRVSWNDTSNNETLFQIERQTKLSRQTWSAPIVVGTVGANVTTFMTSPGPGKHMYRVRAINSAGASAPTAWSGVVTLH